MHPELPRNITRGQIRRTVGIVEQAEWRALSIDERDAADALALHVWWRARQNRWPAFEQSDCTFLTVKWMRRLPLAIGARRTGIKAAACALRMAQERGWIEDTSRTRKPTRPPASIAAAEHFQRRGEVTLEGGKEAQPRSAHSYWWRVFRIPALSRAREALRLAGGYGTGAYALFTGPPTPSVSVGIARSSRAGRTSAPPHEAESWLRSVGLSALGPAMSAP